MVILRNTGVDVIISFLSDVSIVYQNQDTNPVATKRRELSTYFFRRVEIYDSPCLSGTFRRTERSIAMR